MGCDPMDVSELYRAAVETSPNGIWVIDLRGHTIYANPAIARLHRIPEDQLSTLTVWDTLDQPGREQFAAHLADVAQGDLNRSDVDVQWVRSDGSVVWMLVTETMLTDANDEIYALLHRFTDYTERREILRSLRASDEALQDQVAQNELMQAVTSAANRARTLEEVLVCARDLVLRHDDWERARAFMPVGDALKPFPDAGEEPERDALSALELDLARRCWQARRPCWDEAGLTLAFPVIAAGQVHAVIAMTSAASHEHHQAIEQMALRVADQLAQVVARQEGEAELARARDQAMAASQLKSEFLATMSHEIRTPLNGVIGLNDLLLRGRLDAEQQRLASGVQVASRALLDVLNDVLDFSKIEAGRLELERVDFAVRPLLDQVAGLLAETARAKGLDLTLSCHPDLPAVLSGDPTRLAQVVTNLVSNAVKFTETGRVAVTAGLGPVESQPAGRVQLVLEVRDTGIGVAPDRVAGLFDPFTQADASTTRKFGGTGLGLAICREIVAAMDGEIGYLPNPGGGSVFRVTVTTDAPAGDSVPVDGETNADDDARHELAGRRVLLVDEGHDHVLVDQLSYWGLVVESVPSVRAATQQLKASDASAFDLVVASFDTAERDAVQLAGRLRTAGGLGDRPLLTMASGRQAGRGGPRDAAHDSDGGDCGDGGDKVLVRPVLPSVLRATLVRMLVGKAPGGGRGASRVPAGRGRILVVEDHPINQLVVEGMLGALGYLAEVVDDGLAGVEAVAAGGFDAVLMDVQMPRLDGHAATRRIRATQGDGPRLPIIAMTATAVDGERERCLDAGMDDYLTKPIDAGRLDACLSRWIDNTRPPARPAATDEQEPPMTLDPTAAVHAVLDVSRLDELRELDTPTASYVDRAIGKFASASQRDVPVMQESLDGGDLDQLRSVAHRLAGSALNLGACLAGELLRSLEERIRAGEVDDLAPTLLRVDLELARAREAMQDYLARTASTAEQVSA